MISNLRLPGSLCGGTSNLIDGVRRVLATGVDLTWLFRKRGVVIRGLQPRAIQHFMCHVARTTDPTKKTAFNETTWTSKVLKTVAFGVEQRV